MHHTIVRTLHLVRHFVVLSSVYARTNKSLHQTVCNHELQRQLHFDRSHGAVKHGYNLRNGSQFPFAVRSFSVLCVSLLINCTGFLPSSCSEAHLVQLSLLYSFLSLLRHNTAQHKKFEMQFPKHYLLVKYWIVQHVKQVSFLELPGDTKFVFLTIYFSSLSVSFEIALNGLLLSLIRATFFVSRHHLRYRNCECVHEN
jgi:hypothetical protein